MNIIETTGLTKEYRRLRGGSTKALSGLDLEVPAGGVFGFLGPNGSGKTTTVRCLLSLVRPTSGSCTLLGAPPAQIHRVIHRVGSIVETPTLYPGFSGKRNLEIMARSAGVPRSQVSSVLERVGLAERGRDRVKNYSLGMKQRLGIAAALLKDPEVLILDEPANGLDPAGIKEVRDLLRTLGAEGRTVFVSSHILSEVRQICDRVAILSGGVCVATGTVDEVLTRASTDTALLRLEDPAAGAQVLRDAGLEVTVDGDRLRSSLPEGDAAALTRLLAERGLYVSELRPDEADLETVFLELTGERL